MRNKRFKKIISLALSALMLGATAITGLPAGASAASAETTLLTNSGPHAGETYISTYMKGSGYSSDVTDLEISFKYNSLGTPTDETGFNDALEFLVFDSNWGGWNRTTVGMNGYDQTGTANPTLNQVYTVSVPVSVIEGKLTTGNSAMGINLQTGGIGTTSVTITSLKAIEGVPAASEPAVIKGAWKKTSDSGEPSGSLSVTKGTVTVYPNDWNIQVGNMNVRDFTSPVVAVTVEYSDITDTIYPQSEIMDSNYDPIVPNYPQVTKSGDVTYITSIPKAMTSMTLAYDTCTVKKIEIYDKDETCTTAKTNLTNANIIEAMGAGWNLGNALDSTSDGDTGETLWGNPTITKRLFKNLKCAGVDTVRIPVTYLSAVTVDGNNISVNVTKLNAILDRLDDVVKMAVDYDLMVVTNVMHDGAEGVTGKWLRVDKGATYNANMISAYNTIWNAIATKLNKYDQHVVLESMNEIMESGNYGTPDEGTWELINILNQSFVNTVRSKGGNSASRFLMVPGYNTDINQTVANDGFVMPKYNNSNDKIIVTAHFYDPYDFTLNENGRSNITQADLDNIATQFGKMKTKFTDNGIPVVIGEFGAIDKGNYAAIATYIGEVVTQAKDKGLGYIYWDNGYTGTYGLGLWDRYTFGKSQLGDTLIEILYGDN